MRWCLVKDEMAYCNSIYSKDKFLIFKDDKLVKSQIPMAKKKVSNSRRANPE